MKAISSNFGQRWAGMYWSKVSAHFLETGENKTLTVYGELTIAKNHPFSAAVNGFQISPRMQ